MKSFLLLVLCVILHTAAFCQDSTNKASTDTSLASRKIRTNADSLSKYVSEYVAEEKENLKADFSKGRYFSKEAYSKYFDNYFSLLAYERAALAEGSSASLSLKDNDTKLNINFSKKHKSNIFSLGAGLNVTDNSGVIFSDNRPSAGTEFSFSHAILLYRKSLSFFEKGTEKNMMQRLFVLDSIELIYAKKLPHEVRTFPNDMQSVADSIKKFDSLILVYPDSLPLKKAILKFYEEAEKNAEKQQKFKYLEDTASALKDIKKKAGEALTDRQLNTKQVTAFYLQWLSYGVTYRRDNYSTWDSAQITTERVSEQNFNKWGLSLSYNFFWQRTNDYLEYLNEPQTRGVNSVYLNGTYTLSRSNNYSTLDNLAYNVIKTIQTNDTSYTLSSEKKLKDISNKAFDSWWIHTFLLQESLLFGKSQFWGLNLRQALTVGKDKPTYDAKFGVLFRFIDKEKEKSKVNFEIFLAFNDLFDTKNKNQTVWKRKQIGISTTVPFSKLFF